MCVCTNEVSAHKKPRLSLRASWLPSRTLKPSCSVIGVQINGGWSLLLIGVVYSSMLHYHQTNILIRAWFERHMSLISHYSRAVPDKVGGNYWRHAWLRSQGHFFCCCTDWTKLQGFSSAYDFRTPQHFSPSSMSSVFMSAASLFLWHAWILEVCIMSRHARLYMEGKEESVTCAAFDSASNNRRTRFLLFSFSKVGHELYSATRNYQPCGNL